MDKWVALNSEVLGRDKLARLVQYSSRFIWDILESSDTSPAIADRFKTLEYILSSFRKLLRFGKCLDMLHASLKIIHYPDLTIRVALTISKLSQALFLLADHFLWLSRTGFFKDINARKWSNFANRYWLLSIIMNLCRDFYEICRLVDLHRAGTKSGIKTSSSQPLRISSSKDLNRLAMHSYSLMYGHKDVVVDVIKNICDLFIPLSALGYTNISPKTVGLLGVISSAASLLTILDSSTRLYPV